MADAPQVTTPTSRLAVAEGQTARLHCTVRSVPKPIIDWYTNGMLIYPSSQMSISVTPSSDSITGSYESVLQIDGFNYSYDMGNYTCTAKNSMGSASVTIKLSASSKCKSYFTIVTFGVWYNYILFSHNYIAIITVSLLNTLQLYLIKSQLNYTCHKYVNYTKLF